MATITKKLIKTVFSLISIYILSTEAIIANQHNVTYNDRIAVESNYIFIKYEHELKGEPAGFHQTIDISIFNHVAPSNCAQDKEFCLKWADFGTFKITKKDSKCEIYELTSNQDKPLRVRFDTSNVFLFGGPEQDYQSWPADYNVYKKYSYVSKESDSQAVLEPFWLVTNGMYLYVDQTVPLFISQNKANGYFDIIASSEPPYVREESVTRLKYTVCKHDNMKEAYKHAIDNFLGKPSGIPDEEVVRYPIWSTWAEYKAAINSTVVLDYANQIAQSGLPASHLEIDDKWETCYGSLTVDTDAFPDMKNLVERLKNMNFKVTLWTHPFVNLDCQPFHSEGMRNGYFVTDQSGSVISKWWNGRDSYIDFTNPKAVDWWTTRLKNIISQTGIKGYKFDAGESSWSPQLPKFNDMREDHPETILKSYVKACAEFGNMIEVRSARNTQKYPIFVRMIDRETTWEGRLSMRTMIPTLLQMNILGYPFVLPDMIGGNGYGDTKVTPEMFVRWLQINVFMPALQFSYLPTEFGNDVVRITKKFVDLHTKYADKIIEAMHNSVKYGTPVNPPIWWIDPTDPETFKIDSEFLLGEEILVAPVIQQGALSRDIYLPKGYWKDEVNKDAEIIEGPVWLYNYPADLETLPYFTKVAAPEKDDKEDKKNEDKKNDDKKSNGGVSSTPTFTNICVAIISSAFYRMFF